MRSRERISAAAARRIALAAQGFGRPRPDAAPEWRGLRRQVKALNLLQIDSVNVLIRAHYLPLFSRLGPYNRAELDQRAYRRHPGRLFEYWGHEASLLPVELQPLLRWRMARAERLQDIYGGLARFAREKGTLVKTVLAEVEARGAIAASELELPDFDGASRRSGPWWGWHDGKIALEYLFWAGRVTTAQRRGFERVYDLPERVLPQAVVAAPTPDEADAIRELLRLSARALGIATASDLRDYFRLKPEDATPRIAELVETGELLPVEVEGWRQQAFLHRDARMPRRIEASALLVPFDPLVWERARTERLFGFRYRIEIYTPAEKRVYGYYVLPFLLGDRLTARVDLKADRAAGSLRVLGAYAEPEVDRGTVAEALSVELAALAGWLGLERVEIGERGDLAPLLKERMVMRFLDLHRPAATRSGLPIDPSNQKKARAV